MAVVYRHIRLDTNEVFYVGIGKEEKRAYNKNRRSNFWKSIISKTDYNVEILFNDLTWDEACEIERYLIKFYGRRDLNTGSLINLTDGGDGVNGYKHTPERLLKMSINNKGRIPWNIGLPAYNKGVKMSEEQRLKLIGHTLTQEAKDKISDANKGRKRTEDTNKKITDSQKKIILNTETGIFYFGVKEAAESIGSVQVTLNSKLNGYKRNNTNFIYV
jgi:hypothetical protein